MATIRIDKRFLHNIMKEKQQAVLVKYDKITVLHEINKIAFTDWPSDIVYKKIYITKVYCLRLVEEKTLLFSISKVNYKNGEINISSEQMISSTKVLAYLAKQSGFSDENNMIAKMLIWRKISQFYPKPDKFLIISWGILNVDCIYCGKCGCYRSERKIIECNRELGNDCQVGE